MNGKLGKQLIASVLLGSLVASLISGCGASGHSSVPLPEEWIVTRTTESDVGLDTPKDESVAAFEAELADPDSTEKSDTSTESVQEMTETGSEQSEEIVIDNYYPECSQSGLAYKKLPIIHEAVRDAEIGRKMKFWAVEDGDLVETNYERTLRPKTYSYGSTLDFVNTVDLPVSQNGVNIFVTDLFSNDVTSTEFGSWIAENSVGYSLYIMTTEYDGDIYFRDSEDYVKVKEICIQNCVFPRDLLVAVFGNDKEVRAFDKRFQEELPDSIDYKYIHMMKPEELDERDDGIVDLKAAPCFKKNISNVKYDETNINWGLAEQELDEEPVWTNTVSFKKSGLSAADDRDKVKAVLYGDTEVPMEASAAPEISVKKYNAKEKLWDNDRQPFSLNVVTVTDAMPASRDSIVNSKIGGDLIPSPGRHGAVVLELEANNLAKGTYAIEVRQKVREVNEEEELTNVSEEFNDPIRDFLKNQAGYTDYYNALDNECEYLGSGTYEYSNGNGSNSALARLLDLKGLIGELTSAGAVIEDQEIRFRVLITID